MVRIDYLVVHLEAAELVNSPEFHSVLTAYPEFKLVTVGEDEDGDETFIPVTLPLPEDVDESLGVMNMNTMKEFVGIVNTYDDELSIDDPSPAAIEFLKVMDDFSVKTEESRIFFPTQEDMYTDSPEILTAEFDYTTGEYIL